MDLVIVVLVLSIAIVGSEVRLGGRKVQTALSQLLVVWGVLGVMIMAHFAAARGRGFLVFGVFWAGAFLSWFCVRSHIESSILLRMLHLLRGRERTGEELVADYESLYGAHQRRQELVASGLAEEGPDGLRVTAKGKRILAGADWLR